MKKYSESTKAIAWRLAYGETQVTAAQKFGISQGSISSTESREAHALEFAAEKPALYAAARAYLKKNPMGTARGIAHVTGQEESIARVLLLACRADDCREEARMQFAGAIMGDVQNGMNESSRHGYRCGAAHMQQQAATLARMIGGEAGEGIAQAIEALQ